MKKSILGVLLFLLVTCMIPMQVFAVADGIRDCKEYTSADECPKSRCIFKGGVCTSGYVGEDFCNRPESQMALRIVGNVIMLAKVFIPIIIIAMGTMDLFKAVTGGSSEALTKQAKALGIRVAIGLVIFFIPTIVDALLNQLEQYQAVGSEIQACQTCLLHPGNCGK